MIPNFDHTYAEIAQRYDRKFYQMWKFDLSSLWLACGRG